MVRSKLVTLAVLLSASFAFAEEISEFERGYLEGKSSCEPPVALFYCWKPASGSYSRTEGVGETKAQAILKLGTYGFEQLFAAGKEIECKELAAPGR